MYTIEMGTRTIYDGDTYKSHDISLNVSDGDAGTLTFTLPPTHQSFSYFRNNRASLVGSTNEVKVTYGSGSTSTVIFIGYITKIKLTLECEIVVTCRDDFFYYERTYIRVPKNWDGTSGQLIKALLTTGALNIDLITVRTSNGSSSYTSSSSFDGFPLTVTADYQPRDVVSALDIMAELAAGNGYVLYMYYGSEGQRYVGFTNARPQPGTSQFTNLRQYQSGVNLTALELEVDGEDIYNQAFITLGDEITWARGGSVDGNPLRMQLTRVAYKGSDTVYVKRTGGSEYQNIESGDRLAFVTKYNNQDYVVIYEADSDQTPSSTVGNALSLRQALQRNYNYIAPTAAEIVVYHYALSEETPAILNRMLNGTNTKYETLQMAEDDGYAYLTDMTNRKGMQLQVDLGQTFDRLVGMQQAYETLMGHTSYEQRVTAGIITPELTGGSPHTRVGDTVRLTHSDLGIDEAAIVTSMSISLDDPSGNEVTFGPVKKPLSSTIRRIRR